MTRTLTTNMPLESLHTFLILAMAATMAQADFKPKCASQFGVIRHPSDCSIYYSCTWSKPVEKKCPLFTVFSLEKEVCVWPGSAMDDCTADGTTQSTITITPRALTVEERCIADPTAVFPNPTECHQFFNCSRNWTDYRYFPKYKDECIYPKLFNAEKLICEDYDLVKCGQRTERTYGCDYDRNKCGGAHCMPCSFRFANCSGKADGIYPDEMRPWTPYYVICKDERSGLSGTCERDSSLGVAQLFSPDLGRCVSLYEIPRENGGYYLNCTGRADGAHPDDGTNRPNLYYVCQNGQRTSIALCPANQVYGDLANPCVGFVPIQPN